MIRINDERRYIQEDGTTMRVITGSCNDADKSSLPTEDIMNGSYMFIVDSQTVSFFNESSQQWG